MGLTLNINEISACGRELFIVDIVFTVITIVFLILRFWSARISRRKIYPDDIFVVFAFVSRTSLCTINSETKWFAERIDR